MTTQDPVFAPNETKTKNWKAYLFEFVLLFLAVSLGFFADNFREQLSQRSRAKTLLHSLKSDLKADTTELAANIQFYKNSLVAQDSIYEALLMPPESVSTSAYYRQLSRSLLFVIFSPSKTTSDQLRREGLLSDLDDPKLMNYLSIYDSLIEDNRSGFSLFLAGGTYNAFYSSMRGVIDEDLFAISQGIEIVKKYRGNELQMGKGITLKSKNEVDEFKHQLILTRHMSTYTIKSSKEIKRAAEVILDHLEKTYK